LFKTVTRPGCTKQGGGYEKRSQPIIKCLHSSRLKTRFVKKSNSLQDFHFLNIFLERAFGIAGSDAFRRYSILTLKPLRKREKKTEKRKKKKERIP
jgi:hypothetical protein